MTGFRPLLAGLLVALVGYTVVVIGEHGLGLLPIFFGDIARMQWAGQFNTDFLMLLVLLALWTAWRNRFTPGAWGLALVALLLGSGFATVYLLVLSFRENGDITRMLVGDRTGNDN